MNAISACLLLCLAADPTVDDNSQIYRFSPKLEAAIRGQSPTPTYDPFNAGPVLQAPVPAGADPYSSFGVPPMQPDPYQQGFGVSPDYTPFDANPYASPYGYGGPGGPVYAGVNGPQMFRFGYIPKMEMGYIPDARVHDDAGNVHMFEYDSELRYNAPFSTGWVYSSAPQFDYRAWTVGGALSPMNRVNLYRFGWDMELFKLQSSGWTWNFAFNPSINTDTEHNLTSDAWNFDARIAATYQIDQVWMLVLGVQYWDRVDDIIIPHAGVVITPNDLWEFRLLFPKARISRFLGHFWGGHHWLYVSSEYNVEAYQIDTTPLGGSPRNRVQYEDWRLALGLRSDHVDFEKFIEVAWDTGRKFEFREGPNLDISDQVLIRGGIRF